MNTDRPAHTPSTEGTNTLSNELSFYAPHRFTTKTRHKLPHWHQDKAPVFVTWRLADSLPTNKLRGWNEERALWLDMHPGPWDTAMEDEYHRRFSRQIDRWLDQGTGSCVLRKNHIARIVSDALHYFDGDRSELFASVIMPNHVHVLFRPIGPHQLDSIIKSWKGYTAREINKRLGQKGRLWQPDYWDRLIRSMEHFTQCRQYICQNPAKAKLRNGQYILCEKTERGLSCPLRGTSVPPNAS